MYGIAGSVSAAASPASQSRPIDQTVSPMQAAVTTMLATEISRPYQNAAPNRSMNGTCISG